MTEWDVGFRDEHVLQYAPRVGEAIYAAAWLSTPASQISEVARGNTETELVDALTEKLGFCSEVAPGLIGQADGEELIRTVDILFDMPIPDRRSLIAAVLRGDRQHSLPSLAWVTGGRVTMFEDSTGWHLQIDKSYEQPVPQPRAAVDPGEVTQVDIPRPGGLADEQPTMVIPTISYGPRPRQHPLSRSGVSLLPIVGNGHVPQELVDSVELARQRAEEERRIAEEAAQRANVAGLEMHRAVYRESTAERVERQRRERE